VSEPRRGDWTRGSCPRRCCRRVGCGTRVDSATSAAPADRPAACRRAAARARARRRRCASRCGPGCRSAS
jgi:hypothetical protein